MHHEGTLPPEGAEAPATAPTNEELYREGQEHHADHPGDGVQHELGDLVVPDPVANEAEPGEAPDATAPALETEAADTDEGGTDTTEDHDNHDSLWDKQKAETLGAVLQESGQIDRHQRSMEDHTRKWTSPQGAQQLQHEIGRTGRRLEERRRHYGEDTSDYAQADIAAAQREHDQAVERARDNGAGAIAEARRDNHINANIALMPYEELYDSNSSAFATMPTSEFMAVAKEFDDATAEARITQETLEEYDSLRGDLVKSLEKGEHIGNWTARSIEDTIGLSVNADSDAEREIGDKFKAIHEEWFELSPRQRTEKYAALLDEYRVKVQERADADKQARQAILDRYKQDGQDAAPDHQQDSEEHGEPPRE